VTIVEAKYFPATVLLPNGVTWGRTYVVIARGGDEDGLHIWRQPSDVAEYVGNVDWVRTMIPELHQARNGVSVHTDLGLVVVTLSDGCRCGSLARWAGPGWATTVRAFA
jgi:hypothetical protein